MTRTQTQARRKRNPDIDSSDLVEIMTEAFERGVEVGQSLSSTVESMVDVEENPRRRGSKRNSIFLTPAVMQSIGQSGVGRMLTKASNPDDFPASINLMQLIDMRASQAYAMNRQVREAKPAKRAELQRGQYTFAAAVDVARDIYGRLGNTKEAEHDIKAIFGHAISRLPKGLSLPRENPRRNPESTSAEVYAEFHGKPSEQLTEFVYEEHEHENLAQLGELISLTVVTTTGYEATIQAPPLDGPVTEVVQLCSTEDKTQLYLIGGDQCIDIESLGFKGAAIKDLMVIGTLEQIEYCTEKSFHKFKPVDYYHQLGEETGVTPVLLYDPISKLMKIAGGEYEIKDVGIVN